MQRNGENDTIGWCPPSLPPLAAADAQPAQNPASAPMTMTDANVIKINATILKADLRKRGQKTSGIKGPMQQRLINVISNNMSVSDGVVE